MVDKRLILKIFEAFSIQRWNDLIRPFDIVEMDKAAEKMCAAYVIGKFEENTGKKLDWNWMIFASFFDLLKKIMLCDMKSPVQKMLRCDYPLEYVKLNDWVLERYRDMLDAELFNQFRAYFESGETRYSGKNPEIILASRVLRAAHKFSTLRELEMISTMNEEARLTKIRQEISEDIKPYLDLTGLSLLMAHMRPFELIMKIEQLRFQTRWNQTPRIPKTSVLGHCFFVAVMTLLLARDARIGGKPIKYCDKRLFNDFFSALFHDLPEAVTRDIISPVKTATDGLPGIVKCIEDEIVKKELVPLMEDFYVDEILYFTSDEFENRIRTENLDGAFASEIVEWTDLCEIYNKNEYSPVDGKTVRIADHLSALIEADSSIKHGITSGHLVSGKEGTMKHYLKTPIINGIDAAALFYSVIE